MGSASEPDPIDAGSDFRMSPGPDGPFSPRHKFIDPLYCLSSCDLSERNGPHCGKSKHCIFGSNESSRPECVKQNVVASAHVVLIGEVLVTLGLRPRARVAPLARAHRRNGRLPELVQLGTAELPLRVALHSFVVRNNLDFFFTYE